MDLDERVSVKGLQYIKMISVDCLFLTPVYYTLDPFFVGLAVPVSHDNIVVARVISEIWEPGDISKMRSNGARNSIIETFRKV